MYFYLITTPVDDANKFGLTSLFSRKIIFLSENKNHLLDNAGRLRKAYKN